VAAINLYCSTGSNAQNIYITSYLEQVKYCGYPTTFFSDRFSSVSCFEEKVINKYSSFHFAWL
jgi:hypothetical protein